VKHTKDFTAEERAVIRDRRQYQDPQTLALVFGTSPRVINNIARYG
jgi:hypothetical protein